MFKSLMVFILVIISAGACAQEKVLNTESKTNVIFLIGDGMGVAYTSAYRYYQDNPVTKDVELTIFDDMLVGMASTYPDDDKFSITDSAAAATALAAGVKTFNGAIGVNKQQQSIPSMLDYAKEQGYLTAIAVTSQVNHATPAAFVAHVNSRASYNEIADQYVDLRVNKKPKVDLLLGGGQDYFLRKDRNLVKELQAFGYSYQNDINKLNALKKLPALGLFAPIGMTPAIDSDHPLRLAEMTKKSLALLQSKPFFLMLEASQIDWCGHANDIACAMAEMQDMSETMKIIKQFIDENPNTIFVATADHSTGGLSVGANGEYQWLPSVVKKIKASSQLMAEKLLLSNRKGSTLKWSDEWKNLTGIALSELEIQKMQNTLDAAVEEKPENVALVRSLCLAYINSYSQTGWTTKGHTGEDVQIFSYGKNNKNFAGFMDNTEIAKKIMAYLSNELILH